MTAPKIRYSKPGMLNSRDGAKLVLAAGFISGGVVLNDLLNKIPEATPANIAAGSTALYALYRIFLVLRDKAKQKAVLDGLKKLGHGAAIAAGAAAVTYLTDWSTGLSADPDWAPYQQYIQAAVQMLGVFIYRLTKGEPTPT